MPVESGHKKTTLTCSECGKASMSISKREVGGLDWDDNKGWHELRRRAASKGWVLSSSTTGRHFCKPCKAAYDF